MSFECYVVAAEAFGVLFTEKPSVAGPWKHDKFDEVKDDVAKAEPTSTTA